MSCMQMTRRALMGGLGGAVLTKAFAAEPPVSPVAIARCRTYDQQFFETLKRTLDQIGGLGPLVKGKTVAIKLNLTGNPARYLERPETGNITIAVGLRKELA